MVLQHSLVYKLSIGHLVLWLPGLKQINNKRFAQLHLILLVSIVSVCG